MDPCWAKKNLAEFAPGDRYIEGKCVQLNSAGVDWTVDVVRLKQQKMFQL